MTLRSELLEINLRDRGELSVNALLRLGGSAVEGWRYDGMVGKASEARLPQLAEEKLTEDPRLLLGDSAFFEQLASERRRLSKQWTASTRAESPGPRTGHLS